MAGFQNILQGGQPTTRSRQKISDNSGLDLAAGLVGMAGQAIGANYAIAQADKEYQNAFQTYKQGASQAGQLQDQLTAKTKEYRASKGNPDLLRELTKLEDTVRRTKLGETAGTISGLSAKSRMDGAYKTALNKFPAFAAELRSHRDTTMGGGAIGAMIEQSELQQDMAKKESEAIQKEMSKYNLSYGNEEERLQFMAFAKRKGEYELNYEMWMAKGAQGRQIRKDDQAQQTLDFGKTSEARAAASAARSAAAEKRAQEKYEYDVTQRGIKEDQAKATYNKTLTDHKSREQQMAHNAIMNPMTQQRAKNTQADYVEKQKFTKFINNYTDEGSLSDFSEFTADMSKEGYNMSESLAKVEQRRVLAKARLTNIMKSQGQLGSALHTSMEADLDETYNSAATMFKEADPVKAQKRVAEMRKYMSDNELLNDPNFKSMEYLKNTGKWAALQHWSKMSAEQFSMPEGALKERAGREADQFLAIHGLLPEQARAYLNQSIDAGKVVHPVAGAPIAAAAVSKDTDVNDPQQRKVIEIATEDSRWGLGVMSSLKAMEDARNNTAYRGTYNRAFENNHLQQTAALLPSGYGLRLDNRDWSIIKKGIEGGDSDVVIKWSPRDQGFNINNLTIGDYQPFGGDGSGENEIAKLHGTEGWEDVDLQDLNSRLRMMDFIAKNGNDIIKPTYERFVTEGMNKDAGGTAKDLIAQGVAAITDSTVDEAQAGPNAPENTPVAIEQEVVEPFNSPETTYSGPRDVEYNKAWEARGKKYEPYYKEAAEAHGLPVEVLIRQGAQESLFKNTAISPKGAAGVAQFMKPTAKQYGLIDDLGNDWRDNPKKSIEAQAKYMSDLVKSNGGDLATALVEYNGGYKARDAWKAGRIKLNGSNWKETRGYILGILGESAFKG